VEASEGLAQLYAERGGDVTLAAPVARAEELDRLIEDLAQEAIAIVEGATPRRPP
jgi:hypothetical protein